MSARRLRMAQGWIVFGLILVVVGLVHVATHEPNGAGYLGLGIVVALVAVDRIRKGLRGPSRAMVAADRLHRRVVGFLFGPPQR